MCFSSVQPTFAGLLSPTRSPQPHKLTTKGLASQGRYRTNPHDSALHFACQIADCSLRIRFHNPPFRCPLNPCSARPTSKPLRQSPNLPALGTSVDSTTTHNACQIYNPLFALFLLLQSFCLRSTISAAHNWLDVSATPCPTTLLGSRHKHKVYHCLLAPSNPPTACFP